MEILSTGTNILLIVIGFGLLVTVHELGHFIAARWAGIRVEGFAIGMGPSILSYRKGVGFRVGSTQPIVVARTGKVPEALTAEEQRKHGLGETEYSLRLLPLGGYVKMLGQEDANPGAASDDPRSYTSTSIAARMVVVSAGVVMNILMAIVLFVIAFMSGVRFEAPVIGTVQAGSPAATAGLEPGDTITSIDGGKVMTFSDVMIASALSKADDVLQITVDRPGRTEPLTVSVAPETDEGTGLRQMGISPALTATLSPQKDIQKFITSAFAAAGSSAADATALAGWSINRIGATEVATWDDVNRAFEASNGAATIVVWSPPSGSDSPPKTTLLTPDVDLEVLYNASPNGLEVLTGLAGMSPLVRIAEVPADSHNFGVIEPEDIVLSIGSVEGPRMAAFRGYVGEHPGETVSMEVLRNGSRLTLDVNINAEGKVGVFPTRATNVALIARPLERAAFSADGEPTSTPIAPLQLLPRTRINSIGGTDVDDFASIRKALRSASAKAHADGTAATVEIAWTLPLSSAFHETGSIELSAEDVARLHALGYASPLSPLFFEPLQVTLTAGGNPFKAVAMGFEETWDMVVLTYLTIDRLVRGSIGVEQLHGPVGIVHIGTRVIDRGYMYLVFFLAMISVNLAVLNFLPIPIVDGGLFVFLLYEKIKGNPPSIAFQNGATLVGLLLIGALFVVTFYNDIMRLAS